MSRRRQHRLREARLRGFSPGERPLSAQEHFFLKKIERSRVKFQDVNAMIRIELNVDLKSFRRRLGVPALKVVF